ncbi:hypothetical protein [Leptolyngbya ohadii]|nr:hypothetical protein [Leptolyngbya ohadii]
MFGGCMLKGKLKERSPHEENNFALPKLLKQRSNGSQKAQFITMGS